MPIVRITSTRRSRRSYRSAALALAGAAYLVLIAGCSSKDSAAGDVARATASGTQRDPAPPIIPVAASAYREIAVSTPGSIVGSVTVAGPLPTDSVVHVPAAQAAVCGATVPNTALVHSGSALANVVVWIADLRAGKSMPVERRFELTTAHCEYDPHLQAVVTASAVNVHNDDDAPETTRMIHHASGATLATITLIDDGGVVPTDRVAREPGIIELRSTQHPWSTGYVAVFDQPYFDVTAANGTFRIDSLPPGRYRLMAWHEGAVQPVVQDVVVPPSGEAKVKIELHLGG